MFDLVNLSKWKLFDYISLYVLFEAFKMVKPLPFISTKCDIIALARSLNNCYCYDRYLKYKIIPCYAN